MSTLLLLLTTAHAAAGGPAWVEPPPPPRPALCDRLLKGYRRFGLVISGAACSYNRPGMPVSNGPTPFYSRYLQQASCPQTTAPASSPPADALQKPK